MLAVSGAMQGSVWCLQLKNIDAYQACIATPSTHAVEPRLAEIPRLSLCTLCWPEGKHSHNDCHHMPSLRANTNSPGHYKTDLLVRPLSPKAPHHKASMQEQLSGWHYLTPPCPCCTKSTMLLLSATSAAPSLGVRASQALPAHGCHHACTLWQSFDAIINVTLRDGSPCLLHSLAPLLWLANGHTQQFLV